MTDNFPEAGAVAFTTFRTPRRVENLGEGYEKADIGGFVWNYTMKDIDGINLNKRIEGFERNCAKKGWTPVEPRQFGAKKEVQYVPNAKCPKCGGRLISKVGTNGKTFWKCENGKYDFMTKQNTGCDYVDWNAGVKQEVEIPEDY